MVVNVTYQPSIVSEPVKAPLVSLTLPARATVYGPNRPSSADIQADWGLLEEHQEGEVVAGLLSKPRLVAYCTEA